MKIYINSYICQLLLQSVICYIIVGPESSLFLDHITQPHHSTTAPLVLRESQLLEFPQRNIPGSLLLFCALRSAGALQCIAGLSIQSTLLGHLC